MPVPYSSEVLDRIKSISIDHNDIVIETVGPFNPVITIKVYDNNGIICVWIDDERELKPSFFSSRKRIGQK